MISNQRRAKNHKVHKMTEMNKYISLTLKIQSLEIKIFLA